MDTEPGVDFRDFLPKLFFIAFDEASADDDFLCGRGVALPYNLEDGVDALFLGVANEAAGVDDDGIELGGRTTGWLCGLLAIEKDFMAGGYESAGEMFAVDSVFATAEGDDVYSQCVSALMCWCVSRTGNRRSRRD